MAMDVLPLIRQPAIEAVPSWIFNPKSRLSSKMQPFARKVLPRYAPPPKRLPVAVQFRMSSDAAWYEKKPSCQPVAVQSSHSMVEENHAPNPTDISPPRGLA
jgi:hypothetical protein